MDDILFSECPVVVFMFHIELESYYCRVYLLLTYKYAMTGMHDQVRSSGRHNFEDGRLTLMDCCLPVMEKIFKDIRRVKV